MVPFQLSSDGPAQLLHRMIPDKGPDELAAEPRAASGCYDARPPGHFIEHMPDADVVVDPRSRYGVWDGGHLTRLPFIPRQDGSGCNALQLVSQSFYSARSFLIALQGGPHVEQLVERSRDARGSPFVKYMPFVGSLVDMSQAIKSELSRGNYVVVTGCPDVLRAELTMNDMYEKLRHEAHEKFDVHGESVIYYSRVLFYVLCRYAHPGRASR